MIDATLHQNQHHHQVPEDLAGIHPPPIPPPGRGGPVHKRLRVSSIIEMGHGGHGHGHGHSHSHGHDHDEDDAEEGGETLELSCTRGMSSEDLLHVREAIRGHQLGRQAATVRGLREFELECGDLGVPKTSLLSFYSLVQKRRPAFSESDEFPPPVVRDPPHDH